MISAIAILVIGDLWLLTEGTVAHPAPEDLVVQRIDSLKVSNQPWIEIDLSDQHLFVWQGGNQIFTTAISSGKATTPTYPGVYNIQRKSPLDRMRGLDYDLPDVPDVLYFDRGYALHGAYWHNNFGTPVSHGCVNLPLDKAQWLFDWTAIGTAVVIHD